MSTEKIAIRGRFRLPCALWMLLAGLGLHAPLATAGACIDGRPQLYGELFEAAGAALPDGKSLVDAIANEPPAAIVAEYRHQRALPGFDVLDFLEREFTFPPAADTDYRSDPDQDVGAHIDALWKVLERKPQPADARTTLLPLPYRYIVPGGRFNEIYYWDSYFTMLGLEQSGRHELAVDMVRNFAWMIDQYGHIPNGNRTYYLSRSQPPFFAAMVELLAARDGPAVRATYLPQLATEYAFWMDGAQALEPGQAHRRVVRMADGSLLNRYWDDCDTPRAESHANDVATAGESGRPAPEVYRNLRAAAESGWDFSSRWMADGRTLATIRTVDIVPPDLNSLLYRLELTLAEAYRTADQPGKAGEFERRAAARKAAINRLLWDEARGMYADVTWKDGRSTGFVSGATAFPLYFGIADTARAARVAQRLRADLLQAHGLAATNVRTGQQWDLPNGWAPLQWIAISGLADYGQQALADEIATRWIRHNLAVYRRSGKLVEKYDVTGEAAAGGGEYPLQDGFGWTNGVLRRLMALYPQAAGPVEPAAATHAGAAGRG